MSASPIISIPGFRNPVSDVEILPHGDPTLPAGPDLLEMANESLGYLARNPLPEHGYQCRFSFFLLNCPPFIDQGRTREWLDPIAIGDTESRNDIAFNQMREICGSVSGIEPQRRVHERLVGYLREGEGAMGDDTCWVVPYCGSPDHDGTYSMAWTTGKLLYSEVDLFRQTGDPSHIERARRIFHGIRRMASWDTGRAFYPGGWRPWREDRYARGYEGHYPHVIGPVLHYWQTTGEPEALEFALAMAEGIVSDLQPLHHHQPDGSLRGHNHVQMHSVRMMAELGAVTRNWRYLDWAKKAYEYYAANQLDTGWLPEILDLADHNNHSETCLTADMMEIEVWLATAGWPNYWDRVDRTVRNYLVPAQFHLTTGFESLWRDVNGDKSPAEIEQGLHILRQVEGGFLSGLTPNDRVFAVPDGLSHAGMVEYGNTRLVLDMMGCCPPEGMRMLYLAWKNIVVRTDAGVMVNLAFDHQSDVASIVSDMPAKGRIQVTVHAADTYWIRPPAWSPRIEVKAFRNGEQEEVTWGGPAHQYIRLADVHPDEELEVTWPLVRFRQRATARFYDRSKEEIFVYQWTGSIATDVEPGGRWLPLYTR